MSEIDYDKLSQHIVDKMKHSVPPCHLLTEGDIETLQDLVSKKKLMGKGFLWLMFAVAGMLVKDLYQLVIANLHWGQ
ncbi:hypothetical protein KAR91_63270 [Candidatus Pacearchaeota archaeon]|nr:hypothetical protein [Candidatus Pacearchaeota archaeon]